jgi:hypothetical protein
MRNTGTLIATAIAALTLSLASAQAGNLYNGSTLNGWGPNGVNLNGWGSNGVNLNGWGTNGIQTNGWTSNGVSSSGLRDRSNVEGRKDRSIDSSESALRVIGIELPR